MRKALIFHRGNMDRSIYTILIVILLSLSVSALSQQQCLWNQCSGYNPANTGNNGMPLSCINSPALHIENYSALTTSNNIQHQVLYGDVDSSGIMGWVYAPDATTLHIRRVFATVSNTVYNTLSYWTTTSSMTSNYVLARFYNDSSDQKYIYTANSSDFLVYGVRGGSLQLIANKRYSAYGTSRTWVMASDDGGNVWAWASGNPNGVRWQPATNTISNQSGLTFASADYNTMSRGAFDDTLVFRNFYCIADTSNNRISCYSVNDSMQRMTAFNTSVGSFTNLVRGYFAPVKLGGNWYIINAYQFRNGGTATSNPSMSAIQLYNPSTGAIAAQYTGSGYSNVVVGDYNKDGFNEYCFLRNVTGVVELHCYDQAFQLIQNSTVNVSLNDIVMADFNSTQPTMGFASYEGIFYPSQGLIYPSGQTGSAPGMPTVGVTLTASGQIIPVVAYSDTSTAFVMAPFVGSVSCGNGVCDSGESVFTCPADCGSPPSNQTGDICRRDSDCVTNQCDYGHCQLALGGKACTSGTTCISGNCSAGRCTKSSWWQTINAGKTDLAGNDDNTNDFISIFFIFVLAAIFAVVGFVSGSAAMGLGLAVVWILVSSVFFAKVGWLSPFLAFLTILGVIVVGVLTLVTMNAINSRG